MISIEFPVKPHLEKYLVKKYGKVLEFSSNCTLSPIIKTALSKEVKSSSLKLKTENSYTVKLSNFYISKFGVFLNPDDINLFNNEVERLFREEMYGAMVFSKKIYNNKYRDTMREFLKVYDITEKDIKFETLIRDFERKAQKSI